YPLQGCTNICVLARLLGASSGCRLEQGDNVHQRRAAAIASEAIAARRAAPTPHQASRCELAQHLGKVVPRYAEPLSQLGDRQRPLGIACQLKDRIEAKPRRRLQLHARSLTGDPCPIATTVPPS